jgi:hypothetical protein
MDKMLPHTGNTSWSNLFSSSWELREKKVIFEQDLETGSNGSRGYRMMRMKLTSQLGL